MSAIVDSAPPPSHVEGAPHAAAALAAPQHPAATPRKVWVRRGAIAALVLAVISVGAWLGAQRALGPKVDVAVVTRRDVVQTVVSSGRVLAPAEVNLGGLLSGVVSAVHAREGDHVTAGQVLVELDDEELQALVAQARAGVLLASSRVGQVRGVTARVAGESVRQARANLRVAQVGLTRQRVLYGSGAAAAVELEAAQRSFDVARSQVQSAEYTAAASSAGGGDSRVAVAGRVQAEAALRVAESRLSQTQILAPADGVIMRRAVEPGDVVAPTRVLMVLLQRGVTEISATPDERNLADLRIGQGAVVSAEAFPDRIFHAEVVYLAPTIDALRGTVEVKLRVDAPPAYLRPAMTVSVEVEVGRSDGALTLPTDALRDASTRAPWVMLVGADGHTARRAVGLGLRGDEVVEVRSGLREGDRVVPASAGATVRVGQRVRPRSSAVATASTLADAGR